MENQNYLNKMSSKLNKQTGGSMFFRLQTVKPVELIVRDCEGGGKYKSIKKRTRQSQER